MSATGYASHPGARIPASAASAVSDPGAAFLSTLPSTPIERRFALWIVAASVLAFLVFAPIAKLPLEPNQAFLPFYQAALVICELVTAVLLFGQYAILRSRALLVLVCAYLLSAAMAVVHLLSFPGLLSAEGLLGAGPQTTAWLYFLWHGAFPLMVMAYALLKRHPGDLVQGRHFKASIVVAATATLLAAAMLTLLATAGQDLLPALMQGNQDAPGKFMVALVTWCLCVAALVLLRHQEKQTVLDLWLMVVLFVWIFEIALASVLNAGRFDLGWYAGRIYGLLGSTFVLIVLLLENGSLYARIAMTNVSHERHLKMLHEIDLAIAAAQTPTSIAGAVVEPLRDLLEVPRVMISTFDFATCEAEWLAAAGRQRTRVGPGVRFPLHMMGDPDGMRRGEPQEIDTLALPDSPHREALVASKVLAYTAVPMLAGGKVIGAIGFGGERHKPSPTQLRVAREVAAQIAIAITQARLYEQVREDATRLEAENVARTLAEAKVLRLNRVHRILSGINTLIVRATDQQALFEEACRIAAEAGDFPLVWIGIVDPATRTVRPVAMAGEEKSVLQSVLPRLAMPEDDPDELNPLLRTLRDRRPVVSNDVAEDPQIRFRQTLVASGIRSLALLPLVVEGEPVGVFALCSRNTGFFDDAEMKLLVELAGNIAFAIDHIKKEERLAYLAYYDTLTGLPNRERFLERLDAAIRTDPGKGRLFVLCGDVKRFRKINEVFGRAAGDDFLKQIATRLRKIARFPDNLARVSGDCFASFKPEDPEVSEVMHHIEHLPASIAGTPVQVSGQDVPFAYAIGVSVYPGDGMDGETLLRNAESALKKAKASGESCVFYEPGINARAAESLKLESRLRNAVERGEFVLHYQPKVHAGNGRIAGVEALIRWQDPEHGLIPPGHFIPLMEETGLIRTAGLWALNQAVADIGRWRRMGLQAPRVAVNVSPMQLRHKDFVRSVLEVLDGFGEEHPALDIEITESLIMENVMQSSRTLEALRGVGVEVAVDDFGTGYSSLAYLARLPINALKIDRAFVKALSGAGDAVAIVDAIISLAHSLNLGVVAEGVETEEQATILRDLKCDLLQGYLLGRPVPWEELTARLRG